MNSIRSLDELIKSTTNLSEIDKYTGIILRELEQLILTGIKKNMKAVSIKISYNEFVTHYDYKYSTKLVVANVITAMQKQKYEIKISESTEGFVLTITIYSKILSSETLDNFIKQFK